MKTLTGGPLGPMIDRPGSPGAPYRQIEREEEIGRYYWRNSAHRCIPPKVNRYSAGKSIH